MTHEPMDPKVKADLLEALKSGEYRQCQDMLRSPTDAYCCLGVVCDVVAPEGWGDLYGRDKDDLRDTVWGHKFELDNETSYLGQDLLEHIGLSADAMYQLVRINDRNSDFEEAIQFIEEEL